MKLHFLYKITNLHSKRCFVGVILQSDVTWCSVPTRLSELYGRETFQFNAPLLADIKTLGPQNFLVEALHAAPYLKEIMLYHSRIVTNDWLNSPDTYNQVHTSQNPVHNEQKRQMMIERNTTNNPAKAAKLAKEAKQARREAKEAEQS